MVEASFTLFNYNTDDIIASTFITKGGYFDTIGVYFNILLSEKQLFDWYEESKTDPIHRQTWIKFNLPYNLDPGVVAQFYYYPPNPSYDNPRLGISVSFPKVLYGNNVALVSSREEIDQVVQVLNDRFSKVSWLPEIDFGKGLLERVDTTFNHPVGDRVQEYIRALSFLHLPGHTTFTYYPGGVQFRAKTSTSTFYDKRLESQDPKAEGIIRQEVCLRQNYYIARRMKKGRDGPRPKALDATLQDLTPDFARELLQANLRALRLDNCMMCNYSLAGEMLIRHYGAKTGSRLLGYLDLRRAMSRDQLISSGLSERTIQNNEKMLIDAHVSPAIIDALLPLPPLHID